jgi:hypothetical protein
VPSLQARQSLPHNDELAITVAHGCPFIGVRDFKRDHDVRDVDPAHVCKRSGIYHIARRRRRERSAALVINNPARAKRKTPLTARS